MSKLGEQLLSLQPMVSKMYPAPIALFTINSVIQPVTKFDHPMNIGYILAIICAIYVIYDVITYQKAMSSTNKAIWIICALLFSVITAIVYLLVVKRK